MIINLISSPRTISTALMYSFAQRNDMTVFDEPFYGVYLAHTGYDHPGRKEILDNLPLQEDLVWEYMKEKVHHPHRFIKNMASHYKVLTTHKFEACVNVFLIRDPLRIIASYSKVIKEPTEQDVGIRRQAILYQWFAENATHKPIVIDSNDVLDNPQLYLQRLCKAMDLPFQKSMLSWPKGAKAFDGVWAPYWYKNVHRSTGFEKQSSSDDPLPERLRKLYDDCLRDYHFLYEKSLTNPDYASEV
jgi:hypothetical protein